ncbi:MAG TPA: carboxylating nicotinate-nucleotide diphosphorylase [Nitrosomonas sp.]|nr:carboxylating nicotinate-nucleotide diphosphorylase [Nitrosomonas sp.]HMW19836.1 carboxylating nicotinate-nucleotide diphosphorylase [Nitrosomonas sp.]HMW69210.1 carboxylating nicotinate-nucleotide diphosphorylase [Nitrosomonas sp.]HMY60649.1 carboxylating nicotinate-nucleotide diphosphorylase [Nitrosomonas sp.]HMY89783.1 carboxylating nicotinate-nucleotide diphosphorylase [Nitrosomonas sp.]
MQIDEIRKNVAIALAEDVGSGDLTAQLISNDANIAAQVISREAAILCGIAWFEACFNQLSSDIAIHWLVKEGDILQPNQTLCKIEGNARTILTAERSALNFLQFLSAVATQTHQYVKAVSGTNALIVDTRKTIPGLRYAEKYAVRCGGGANHRIGLYDGILIKENHIIASGSIAQTLHKARTIAPTETMIEIEVETLDELHQALHAGATMILLDNFELETLRNAVILNQQYTQPAILEASGNITLTNVRSIAETGIDRISIGSLTKNIKAIDLSMRFLH